MNPAHHGCLTELRVLDLSRVLAGPFCTQLLGDMGAEVIKVEQPGKGDDTRQWGPPWLHGESAYYLSCNRNKKSVTINLQSLEGQELIRRLARESDVFVENFKVGALAKYGLDYRALKEINPRLVYCSITGYGQDGPAAHLPGYDFIIQAQGGIMSLTGEVDGEPMKVGVAIADIVAGLYAANSVLAALLHRERRGEGQFIDISLLDSQVSWLANVAMNYLVSNEVPGRYGNAHPNIVPYQTFQTADGYIAVGVGNDDQFRRFCEALGLPEFASDPRFSTNSSRVENRSTLIPTLQENLLKKTTEEWLDEISGVGVPVGPINNVHQVFSDPQVLARNMLRRIVDSTGALMPLVGPVAKFSLSPSSIRSAPPRLGEHTDEVLGGLLNLSTEMIADYRRRAIL
jgi:formyl-CoA transferase